MSKILLIDTDEQRAQLIERRLRLWGLSCSIAESFLFALTTLEWQRPDLILMQCESMPEMSAREFASTVRQDPTLAKIPLVLVTEHDTSLAELSRDFDLVLASPDPRVLVEHLARFLKNRQAEDSSGAEQPDEMDIPGFAQREISRGQFAEMLDHLNLGLRSGKLILESDDQSPQTSVIFDHGQMVHAVFGGLEGPPAFRRLLREFQRKEKLACHFEPEPRWQVGAYPRTIQQANRQRLLEQTNRQDEFATQDIEIKKWYQ